MAGGSATAAAHVERAPSPPTNSTSRPPHAICSRLLACLSPMPLMAAHAGARRAPLMARRQARTLAVTACLFALAVVVMASQRLLMHRHGAEQRDQAGGGSGLGSALSGGGAAPSKQQQPDEDWGHPLYARIEHDLLPFKRAGGITLRHVEQAYCQSSSMSFRLQARLCRWGCARGRASAACCLLL